MELTTEEINKNRSDRLKSARKNKGLSLSDVAFALGTTKASVSRWELGITGGIKLPQLQKLAKLYEVDTAWLFGYDVPMLPETSEHKNVREMINAWMRDASFEDLKKFEALARITFNKGDLQNDCA